MKTLRAGEKLNQHPIITVKKCHQAAATELEADGAEITQGWGGQAAEGHRQQEDRKEERGWGELENKCKKNTAVFQKPNYKKYKQKEAPL